MKLKYDLQIIYISKLFMTGLNKTHIENLVTHFYQKVRKDEVLGPIFDKAQVDWNEHIPRLCQFWNSVMLKTNEYHGNAYQKHLLLKQFTPIEEQHFTRWLNLFRNEALHHLPVESAQKIIHRASLIAESLQFGILSQKKEVETC
ncbi:group III truncated hemoglobin [Legionella sainthelensi]|uniref:group III truncated hemoglobin n=1 Tax=Legionella sainthelensi TaxID=28087 RepID=UPI002165D5C6|nr:group III truncated hemoglobin [Legionella sainthelensi]